MTMNTPIDLSKLKEEIPYKWRVQSLTGKKDKFSCVSYIDSRQAQARLDEVCGPENWQDDYKEIKNNLYCGVAIRINGEWNWKHDCGTESQSDGEKGEASDSFKRACVKWGLGRFLYDIKIRYVSAKEINGKYKPVDNNGNIIYDLTEHFKKIDIGTTAGPKQTKSENVTTENSDRIIKQKLHNEFIKLISHDVFTDSERDLFNPSNWGEGKREIKNYNQAIKSIKEKIQERLPHEPVN